MDADHHVQAYEAHCERLDRLDAERQHAQAHAEKAAIAAEWAAMSDEDRGAILDDYTSLNLQGRLEDGRYFDQWLAVAMQGYVGD